MEINLCRSFSQRTGLKINLCLSLVLNLCVILCSGVAFTFMMEERHKEAQIQQMHMAGMVMLIAAFILCYSVLGVTIDSLALLGLFHKNAKLLLPWLAWGILDSVLCLCLIVLTLIHTLNGVILLLTIKIVWSLFIWINMKELYKEQVMHVTCQQEVLY